MNYRLISDADKATNKLARAQRRNAMKRQKRAQALRVPSSKFFGTILTAGGDLEPEEFQIYMTGRSRQVRRIDRKIRYLAEMTHWPVAFLPAVPESELVVVDRPARVLRVHRRGQSPSGFAAPPIDISDAPLDQGIDPLVAYAQRPDVRERFVTCVCRSRVFEAAFKLFWGGGWENCKSMINLLKYTEPPVTEADQEAAKLAMRYPGPYDAAREAYAAMVAAWNLPVGAGDWGARLATDLEDLRPGINIPARLRRDVYLIKFIDSRFGQPRELDFYSLQYKPLFTIPLGLAAWSAPESPATRTFVPVETAPIAVVEEKPPVDPLRYVNWSLSG